MLRPGATGYDMIRFQAQRGEYGPLEGEKIKRRRFRKSRRSSAIRLGGRYERRTISGRYIEFSYSPLSDGSVLGVYRDITELKDREQALARAKEDIERTRAVMQTILDNMNDGVILLDADFNFVFGNEQFMGKLKVPPMWPWPENPSRTSFAIRPRAAILGRPTTSSAPSRNAGP